MDIFKVELANRWFELREDILKKENIEAEFMKFIDSIPPETYEKESNKWGKIPGYDINQIKDFIEYRLNFVDNLMNERKIEDKKENEMERLVIYAFIVALAYIVIETVNKTMGRYKKIKTEERF